MFSTNLIYVSTGSYISPVKYPQFINSTLSQDTPSGRWDHDKYEGGARNGKFGGRLGGASRGGTKLIISNLEYSVNDQDIRVGYYSPPSISVAVY